MVQGWSPNEAREVCGVLAGVVRSAWERGWQPADLHRVVRRNSEPAAVKVLGDVLAAAVGEHAEAAVDPRWLDQLEEIGASCWWSTHTDHLTARAERESGGWTTVRLGATLLQAVVPRLPPLERIGPLPGEATHLRAATADVDDRLLTKVRMMLAKAESTPYEAEAETFTAAAQALMARHSIDRAMVDQQTAQLEGGPLRGAGAPHAVRVGTERPYEGPKASLVSAVARANRCRAVWHQDLGFSTVVGFEVDLHAVELLYASLLVQATSAMQAEGSRTNKYGESRTRSFRSSFLEAFAQRIGERLSQAARDEEAEAARQRSQDHGAVEGSESEDPWEVAARQVGARAHPGDEMALVLADREVAVDRALRDRFPHLRTSRSRSTMDADGWRSGRAAAERAHLGVRGRLA